jgi:hypothetical protein
MSALSLISLSLVYPLSVSLDQILAGHLLSAAESGPLGLLLQDPAVASCTHRVPLLALQLSLRPPPVGDPICCHCRHLRLAVVHTTVLAPPAAPTLTRGHGRFSYVLVGNLPGDSVRNRMPVSLRGEGVN